MTFCHSDCRELLQVWSICCAVFITETIRPANKLGVIFFAQFLGYCGLSTFVTLISARSFDAVLTFLLPLLPLSRVYGKIMQDVKLLCGNFVCGLSSSLSP